MRRERMFGWYDPKPLLRLAGEVAVSGVFAQYADERRTQALAHAPIDISDYRRATSCDADGAPRVAANGALVADGAPRDEMWLTYISDTGDGWDSTYAVAYHAAHPTGGAQRGDVLVLGGDQVYPVASTDAYRRKLVAPFAAALPRAPSPAPHVYSLPGNHDWYDNLVAFESLFCGHDWFGGWYTPQSRSYFALRLPQRWWLIAADLQLCSDIDKAQLDYFRAVAAQMQRGDAIILCLPEPHWIYEECARHYASGRGRSEAEAALKRFEQATLAFLERHVFGAVGAEMRVMIAGDLHHYRRHARASDQAQRITCGGGGAFLHPTHPGLLGPRLTVVREPRLADLTTLTVPPSDPARCFHHATSFPDTAASARLTFGNLLFAWRNPLAGCTPAVLYLTLCWLVQAPLGGTARLGEALAATLTSAVAQPAALIAIVAAVAGIIAFADQRPWWFRWTGGVLHAALHLAGAFALGWAAARVAGITEPIGPWLAHQPDGWRATRALLAGSALVFAGGWLIGSFILGLYLLAALNLVGAHANEAFSALRSADFKSWLHLHIGRDGQLRIHVRGLRRVPRRWRDVEHPGPSDARCVPVTRRADEQPIEIEVVTVPGPLTSGATP